MSSVLFRCLPVLLHFSIYSPSCTVLLEARPLSGDLFSLFSTVFFVFFFFFFLFKDVKRLRDWNDLRPPTRRAPHKRERDSLQFLFPVVFFLAESGKPTTRRMRLLFFSFFFFFSHFSFSNQCLLFYSSSL